MAKKDDKRVNVTITRGKAGKKGKKKEAFSLGDLPDELMERGREIWLAGLGALSTVEEEGARLFHGLVARGEALEKESRERFRTAKQKLDEARGQVGATLEEIKMRGEPFGDLDERLLSVVEKTVGGVLQRFDVPSRTEVQELTRKVDALSQQVAALTEMMAGRTTVPTDAAAGVKVSIYHVVPHASNGWAVMRGETEEPVSVHETKTQAVEAGRILAKQHVPARLVIHKRDGTVQDTATYDP